MEVLGKKYGKCECCKGYHTVESVLFRKTEYYHTCNVKKCFYQTSKDIILTQIAKDKLSKEGNKKS